MGQTLPPSRFQQPVTTDPMLMAARLMEFAPASDAEALKLLRASFPNSPLSMRVAALAFLMRRSFPRRQAELRQTA